MYLPGIVLQISFKDQVQAKRVKFVLRFQLIKLFSTFGSGNLRLRPIRRTSTSKPDIKCFGVSPSRFRLRVRLELFIRVMTLNLWVSCVMETWFDLSEVGHNPKFSDCVSGFLDSERVIHQGIQKLEMLTRERRKCDSWSRNVV